MLGNEPLSKWSLVTNSQSKLWGGMLMKCQSCHFISSNYRLACRPFNDHLQRCLQCIRGSTKSPSLAGFHFIWEHTPSLTLSWTCTNSKKHTETHTPQPHIPLFSSQTPHFLFICNVQKTRTHWAAFSWPANQKLNRTFVITIALYLSITLHAI